jgi:hypothetical protein
MKYLVFARLMIVEEENIDHFSKMVPRVKTLVKTLG